MRKIIEIMSKEPDRWFSVSELKELRGIHNSNIYVKMNSLYKRGEVERRYKVHQRSGVSMQVYRIQSEKLVTEGKGRKVYFCEVITKFYSQVECDIVRQDGSTIPTLTQYQNINNWVERFQRGYSPHQIQLKSEDVHRKICELADWEEDKE